MTLINTLLSHSTDNLWEELAAELERLNTKKAVTVSSFDRAFFIRTLTWPLSY